MSTGAAAQRENPIDYFFKRNNDTDFGYGVIKDPQVFFTCFLPDTATNSISVLSSPGLNFSNFALYSSHHAAYIGLALNIQAKTYPRGEDSMSSSGSTNSSSHSSHSSSININQELTIEPFAHAEQAKFKGNFYLVTSHALSKGYLSLFTIKQIENWWYMKYGRVITPDDVQRNAEAFTKADSDSQKDLEFQIRQNFDKHFKKHGAGSTFPSWTKFLSKGQTTLAALFTQYLQTFTFKVLHNITTTGKFCSIDLGPNSDNYSGSLSSKDDKKLVEIVSFGAYVNLEFRYNNLYYCVRLYLDNATLRRKFGNITICYRQSSFFKSLLSLSFFDIVRERLIDHFTKSNISPDYLPSALELHTLFSSTNSSFMAVDLGCARQTVTLFVKPKPLETYAVSLPFVFNGGNEPGQTTFRLMGDIQSGDIFLHNDHEYDMGRITSTVKLPSVLAETVVVYNPESEFGVNTLLGFNDGVSIATHGNRSHSHSRSPSDTPLVTDTQKDFYEQENRIEREEEEEEEEEERERERKRKREREREFDVNKRVTQEREERERVRVREEREREIEVKRDADATARLIVEALPDNQYTFDPPPVDPATHRPLPTVNARQGLLSTLSGFLLSGFFAKVYSRLPSFRGGLRRSGGFKYNNKLSENKSLKLGKFISLKKRSSVGGGGGGIRAGRARGWGRGSGRTTTKFVTKRRNTRKFTPL